MPADQPRNDHPDVSGWLDEIDEEEYEIEPPDEEVLELRRRSTEEAVEKVEQRAQVEPITPPPPDWEADIPFQFSIKDLFFGTAILAMAITAWKLGGTCPAFVVGSVGLFFWTLLFMERHDPTPPQLTGEEGDGNAARQDVWSWPPKFSFSMADLLIATTLAAVGFGVLTAVSRPFAAAILGVLVLAGVVLYWMDAPLPRQAVLAWFFVAAMYALISLVAIVETALQ